MHLHINKLLWTICIIYLFYLSAVTQSVVFQDALGYQQSAQEIHDHGFMAYWSTGLHREPVYPLFVAMVLHAADAFKMDYMPVLLVAQAFVFLLTLWLLEKLLSKIGIGVVGRWTILLYAVFSPAFIYTVHIEWSEIAAYPLVLLFILSCIRAWQGVFPEPCSKKEAIGLGMLMGVAAVGVIMVKAVAEMVCLCMIIPWIAVSLKYWQKNRLKAITAFYMVLGFLGVYLISINAYKAVNYHYGKQYVLTNRGSWALYGNTARGMAPLTGRQWWAGILSVPTNGRECQDLLKPPDECRYWTFEPSDALGQEAMAKLQQEGHSAQEVDQILVGRSVGKLLHNPLQALANSVLEGMKFMFWEYNAWGQFAVFPSWLEHLYQNKILYILLHYGMALLTLIAVIYSLVNGRHNAGIFFSSLFIVSFIFFYSFFYCSGRYAMPLAPLFLAQIAFMMKSMFYASKEHN